MSLEKKIDEEIVEQENGVEEAKVSNDTLTEEPTQSEDDRVEDVGAEDVEPTEDPDTFPRDYVEKLRDENAKYRQRAQQVDDYAERLHTALTAATGRLQDASDLPFDQSHLDDPEALETAIQELLANKPHLGSRKPTGNIGQGVTKTTDTIDLAGLLRSRA